MRVAHLIWSLQVGGSETMLVDIANEQANANEVILVIGNDAVDTTLRNELSNRVHVELVGRPAGSRNPWYALKLFRTLRKIGPDVIHAHQESFLDIVRWLPTSKVLTVHDTRVHLRTVNKYDAIYGISEAVCADIVNRCPAVSPTVIHNGICPSKIPQKTQYGQRPFRVVQISRLYHEKKGQDILLRALHCMSDVIERGQVVVDFVGEGPSMDYLRKLASELGVEKGCRFLGAQPRRMLYERLHTYDLLVQPSRYEGFGLTVVEAMAAGVPVLVSNIEGPMEIIDNGKYGYYFQVGDHLDCSEKMIHIMKNSEHRILPEQLQRVAEYARRRFDITETANLYLDAYGKLISRALRWKRDP